MLTNPVIQIYRLGYCRPDEIPAGAAMVQLSPEDDAMIRRWYQERAKPHTNELWGPRPDRTVAIKIPIELLERRES